MANVSVAESKTSNDLVAVTVDMPYPLWARAERDPEAVSFDTFSTGDLSTEPGSRTPVPADKLPTWTAFRDLVKQHDGTLKDIRWDDTFACRALGAISLRKIEKTASTR